MSSKYLNIALRTGALAIIVFLVNFALLYFSAKPGNNYHYPLYLTYLFFWVFTLIILSVLTYLSQKNKEQVGYVFLFLTAAKMGVSYFFARPILTETISHTTEKVNFFFVFILFLAIEAYYTVRLLNNN